MLTLFCLTGLLLGSAIPGYAENLIRNAGFENFSSDKIVADWMVDFWNSNSSIGVTDQKVRSGKYAAIIDSAKENDVRLIQRIMVEPETVYRFTGWVATEGIPAGKFGANLSVLGGLVRSASISGTNEWQLMEFIFKTLPNQTTVTIGVRLGFYGSTTSGIAYFDDLALEKVTDPQVAFTQLDSQSLNYQSSVAKAVTIYEPKTIKTLFGKILGFFGYQFWIVCCYALFFAVLARPNLQIAPEALHRNQQLVARIPVIFGIMTVAALLIRIPLLSDAPLQADFNNFKAWALRLADTGPVTFYAPGYYCDYPPFSMYVFWIIGKIAKLFNFSGNDFLFNILLKLPALLCDIAGAWLILALTRKKNPVLGLAVSVIYLFLPVTIYSSSYRGLIDSYYVLLILAALYLIVRQNRPEAAAALVVAAGLTKVQALAVVPVFLIYLFQKYHWKRLIGVLVAGLGALVLIVLPFNLQQPFTWIIDLYRKQAELYPYASANVANFLALLNGNNQPATTLVLPGVSFAILGYVLFLAGTVWSCYYYRQKPTWGGLLGALVMSSYSFFMFFPKLHESNLLLVLALLILLFAAYRDKRIFYIALLLSISHLLNTHVVTLKYQNLINEEMFGRVIYILSIVNTAIFVTVGGIFQLGITRERRNSKGLLRQYDTLLRENQFNKLTLTPFALTRRDYLAISVIALVYAAVVFFRLGSWSTPQTGLDLNGTQAQIEVEFEQPSKITTVAWYDGEGTGQLQLESYAHGKWQVMDSLSCDGYYVLNRKPLMADRVERVRLTPQGAAGHLKEIAFLDGERVIPVKTVYSLVNGSRIAADRHPLFDEAQKVTEKPSNLNSTYFDEIYHGRTAYEFVKKSAVYETTHPPLGKDILALGVIMFGMNPFGMRVMHGLIGICFIIALFFLGRQVLSTRFGAYATMLAGFFDFMPLVQSRYSTIDTTSVLFITLMLIFTFKYVRQQLQPVQGRKSWRTIALIILFYALGADVKWTANYGFAGVVVCVAVVKLQQYLALKRSKAPAADLKTAVKTFREKKGQKPAELSVNPLKMFWYRNFGLTVAQWLGLFLLIAPIVYYLAYIPFLKCQQIDEVFSREAITQVIENQKGMYNYHSQLTATHPFSSNWWSWPFNFKPLWIYTSGHARPGFKGSIVSMGNPVIWCLGWIAVLIWFYQILVNRKFSLLHLVFIAMFSLYLPWVLVTRATFIYHFFPVLPLYYILGVTILEPLWQMGKAGRQVVWGISTLAVGLWLLFYPVLTGLEVPEKYIQTLRWFPRDWIF